jgi:hypothetical protein
MIPPFLDIREIAGSCAEAELGDVATQALIGLAQRIAADAELRRIVGAAHHSVYETKEVHREPIQHADAALGADAELLHALLVLDSMRLVRQKQAARGVPAAISWAVNQRHAVAWLKGAIERSGSVGLADWMPGWFRKVGSGDLYRLGRLEFMIEAWECPFRVYINMHTSEVVVLAEAGQSFTQDGYLVGRPAWMATLAETEDAVLGTPISPRGHALQQQARLPRSDWRLALGPGDTVLDIHIPEEGALTLDALRDALAQAGPFFDHYYPERRFVAYTCESWLFSPQLEAMLPPDSNILRWQREGYLLPSDAGGEWLLLFVFGSMTIDLATAPRDTTLRRAVIEHLARERPLFCGAYLLLRSDLGRFGAQPYRRPTTDH